MYKTGDDSIFATGWIGRQSGPGNETVDVKWKGAGGYILESSGAGGW